MDPHHNIFFYYRGPSANSSPKVRDIQIENNTTKALINTLRNISESHGLEIIEAIAGRNLPRGGKLRFSLQAIPTQIRTAKVRLVLVLMSIEGEIEDQVRKKSAEGRPDGWIYDDTFAVMIEAKTNIRTVTRDQLRDHLKNRKVNWDSSVPPVEIIQRQFDQVYRLIRDFFEKHREKGDLSDVEIFLLSQFRNYLKEIGMHPFEGFGAEHFLSISALGDDDNSEFEDLLYGQSYLKRYFEGFAKQVESQLQGKHVFYLYPFDGTQKRFYCHFAPRNNINLNINLELSAAGINVHMWLPFQGGTLKETQADFGMIRKDRLRGALNKFQRPGSRSDLVAAFSEMTRHLKYTYLLDLCAAQYWHIKTSGKGPQRMQKRPSTRVISIALGTENIIDKKSKSYVVNPLRDIFDDTKGPTIFLEPSREQLDAFFQLLFHLLWDRSEEAPDPLSRVHNIHMLVQKQLPATFVSSLTPGDLVRLVADIVMDLHIVINFFNGL